jgi:hypothetical protein
MLDASQKLDILEMGKITTAKGIRMGTNQSRQVSFHYIRMLANDTTVYIFCGVSKSKIIDDFYMFLKIRSA